MCIYINVFFIYVINEGVSLPRRVFKDSFKMAMEIILGEDHEVQVFTVLAGPRGRHGQSKGPKVGVCLAFLRNMNKTCRGRSQEGEE